MFEKLPSLLAFEPGFYVGGPIAVHLPFLYDLMAANRPKIAITLGFAEGEAHFAFCQAARAHELDCRCVAIRRDDGSDADDLAWSAGKAHAQEVYSGMAELRSESSAELAQAFADGAVDLLLIDDCDTGAEISRDLLAWTTKLAPGALVLLHGTRLERRDSPAMTWRHWTSEYPAAEFTGGIGLGVARYAINAAQTSGDLFAELFGMPAPALEEMYRFVNSRVQADARAKQAAHDRAALELQTSWLHSLLDKTTDVGNLIQVLTDNAADLKQKVEPLQRDRAKAQLIMDAQAEQLESWAAQMEAVRTERDKLREQVKQQKATLKAAKKACRKGGSCFHALLPPAEKPRRPVHERIVREVNRWPRRLRQLWAPPQPPPASREEASAKPEDGTERYARWIAEHEPDAAALDEQRRLSAQWSDGPKISLLLLVLDTPADFLEAMLNSVAAQTYSNWELCLVDAGSKKPETLQLVDQWSRRDERLRLVRLEQNRGIAENTNAAFEVATGSFVTCIDHDDALPPFALFEVACAIRGLPEGEIFYSDEDRLNETGRRHSPFFKPAWSPALLRSSMYLGHLTVYRRELVAQLGGWRKEFDLSQDYDLALRATDEPRVVGHIPHVLYHWREHPASGSAGGKPDARKTNLAALGDAMRRRNLPAEIIEYPSANRARLMWSHTPKVSIIIPTDSPVRGRRCIDHLLATTAYPDYEIVIVTNSGLAEVLNSAKPAGAPVQCVPYDEPFNFSEKCNRGATAATGDRLIFYNDDVEPKERDWIENLIEPLEDPEVGAVAPKLLYETGKIQHAGLVTGVRGLVGTAFHQWPADSTEYTNLAQSLRDVSALSGACLAMRRKDFYRAGEWDAVNTPIAHSDLDLCFKIRELGMRCVYTPFATLTHRGHESIGWEKPEDETASRDKASAFLLKRWAGYTCGDPYFPENMRDWIYADSPTPIRMWGRNEREARESRRDLLFVSHDLTWSGAPLILLQMAKWCRAQGYFVTIMAPEDGPLRAEIAAAGFPLLVDELITKGHPSFTELARQFDCVVASTIFAAPVVNAARLAGIPHLWWIHEGRVAENYFDGHPRIRIALAGANLIVTPDTRSAQVFQPFREKPIRILPYGIEDPRHGSAPASPRRAGPVTFLLLGSVEYRKGQEVFLEALRRLPTEVLRDARFEIVGRPHDPALTTKVRAATDEIPSLSYHGGVSPEEALGFIRAADVVVCASWDETGPLILIEALALGKTIVSTKVGTVAEHLSGDDVGFFIAPGNAKELAASIEEIVRRPEQLERLGRNARDAYERFFTFERFGAGFLELVEEAAAGTPEPHVARR